jgi:hypothetical protein
MASDGAMGNCPTWPYNALSVDVVTWTVCRLCVQLDRFLMADQATKWQARGQLSAMTICQPLSRTRVPALEPTISAGPAGCALTKATRKGSGQVSLF